MQQEVSWLLFAVMPVVVMVMMMPVMVVLFDEHDLRGGRHKQAKGKGRNKELRYLHGRE
jgi:hypothetical protein